MPNNAADTPNITIPNVNGNALNVPAHALPFNNVPLNGVLNTLQAYA